MPKKFKVHFVNEEEGIDQVIMCPDDTTVLDAAEEANLDLPYSCRAGACSSCAGRILEGEINQEDQAFLDDDQVDNGFILTCVSYPKSDVKIQCHAEDDIF